MSDLSRYLPLSNRPKHDESAVTSTWNAELAEVLTSLLGALAPLSDAAWQTTSRRATWTVHDLLAHLAWRLSTPRGERWRASARSLAEQGFSGAAAELAIARRASTSADGSPTALISRFTRLRDAAAGAGAAGVSARGSSADAIDVGTAGGDTVQTGIGALAEAVIAALDVSASLGVAITVPERACGAVALRRALEAPTEIKAVTRGRTLAATDADWSFGHGPVLQGTSAEILLFLYGRSDTAPSPAPPA
ncbi:TIGR03083 family protein [Agromyces sp. CF514]|uniref:maleylpyruvate isomerase family mycothiol-dependent enzyme n=1 Tax=Agromyces sp. CF514 TaxID=1881031 RepID=UPI0008DEB7DA|nr:maleylpyruvate isomerase family mycothiol-dependent enzyme [Agromyces sp. CF514]SFR70163.1 TIGR03083 family protein [Agromyces sp. CF514]